MAQRSISFTVFDVDGKSKTYKSTACFSHLRCWDDYVELGTPSHLVYKRLTDNPRLEADVLLSAYQCLFAIPMFGKMLDGTAEQFMETCEVRVDLNYSQQLVMQLLSFLRMAEDAQENTKRVGMYHKAGCSPACSLFLASRFYGKAIGWQSGRGHDPMPMSLPAKTFKLRVGELLAGEDTATFLGKYPDAKTYRDVESWWYGSTNRMPDRQNKESLDAYRERINCIYRHLKPDMTPTNLQKLYEEIMA